MPDRRAYERLRAAHLHAVRAALEDHVERVDWPRERLDRYRTEQRLRALLGIRPGAIAVSRGADVGLGPRHGDRHGPRPAAADD